jgi:molybdopterin molybdotransferase
MAEPFGPEGLQLAEARALILDALVPLGNAEHVAVHQALGRVAAEDLEARAAIPGFAASIMDGYAIADKAIPSPGQRWELVGSAGAGAPYWTSLKSGEAIRILTGAPIPEGCSRVLPQELVACCDNSLELLRPAGANPWIRQPDEEAAPGQQLLAQGSRLGPADLGRLAGCGISTLSVQRQPKIGLLISGDELVEPGQPRSAGQIWESNSTLLEALLQRLGYRVADRRIVGDDPNAMRKSLIALAESCDVIVSSGGISAGDSDWIRPLVSELGTLKFWKLFLKPGRPFAWGELKGKPFFGLPGNPVAAAITALQLVWPALQRLEGAEVQLLPRLVVRLADSLRRGPGRPELARARLRFDADGNAIAELAGSQASSRIGSLQGADLLLEIPAEAGNLDPGTKLWAQLLRLPVF